MNGVQKTPQVTCGMVWLACPECGVPFALTELHYNVLQGSSDGFHCPNGHEIVYHTDKHTEENAIAAERKRNGGMTFKELQIQAAHHAEQAEARISELEAQLNGGIRREIEIPDDPPDRDKSLQAAKVLTQQRKLEAAAPAPTPETTMTFTVVKGVAPIILQPPASKEVTCTDCGASFKFTSSLKRHLQRKHKRTDAEEVVSKFRAEMEVNKDAPPVADAIVEADRIVCMHCGKPYKNHVHAIYHFRSVHGMAVGQGDWRKVYDAMHPG